MDLQHETVQAYFVKLGLEPEIADIYLALHVHGPQSISGLSRNSGVERTRIYRMLDQLKASGLVEIEIHNKYSIFRASPVSNLHILISKKEQEVRELQAGLTTIEAELARSAHGTPATGVQFYQGADGIKQMLWNQTKAHTESLSILYENMQNRTKLSFFERWVRTCNQNGIAFKGIISDHFIKTQQEWYGNHTNERLEKWTARFVPDTMFPITHSTVIYNDVTAYYNWRDNEVFGLEITNQEIADAQRNFFTLLWAQAKPVDDLQGVPND